MKSELGDEFLNEYRRLTSVVRKQKAHVNNEFFVVWMLETLANGEPEVPAAVVALIGLPLSGSLFALTRKWKWGTRFSLIALLWTAGLTALSFFFKDLVEAGERAIEVLDEREKRNVSA